MDKLFTNKKLLTINDKSNNSNSVITNYSNNKPHLTIHIQVSK